MRKTLTTLLVAAGLVFAQTPAPKPKKLSDKTRIVQLEAQVMELRAELTHVHDEDIYQLSRWIWYLNSLIESLEGNQLPVPATRPDSENI